MNRSLHRRTLGRQERQHWTGSEARAFLDTRGDSRLAAVWRLAIDTGARSREISDLTWPDVDLDRGTVTIRDPKHQRSRTVVISPATVRSLRAHVESQRRERSGAGNAWLGGIPGATGHIVTNKLGQRCRPAYLTRAFRSAQEGLALPRIPLHGLRHTSAYIAFAAGESTGSVARRLGHLDAATALDVYPHLLDSRNRTEGDEE